MVMILGKANLFIYHISEQKTVQSDLKNTQAEA